MVVISIIFDIPTKYKVKIFPQLSKLEIFQVKVNSWFKTKYSDYLILTKQELELKDGNLVLELENQMSTQLNTFPLDEMYLALVKIMLASAYSSENSGSMNLDRKNLNKETLKNFLGEGAEAIGLGVDATLSPTNDPNYEEFKNAPAGSITSLLFWNKEQVSFLFNDLPRRVLLYGEYGTGKTLLVVETLRRWVSKQVGDKRHEDQAEIPKQVGDKRHEDQAEIPKCIFISCLKSSYKGSYDDSHSFITPIYDLRMRVIINEFTMKLNEENVCAVEFFNAEDICKKMDIPLSGNNFYSKLPQFIEKGEETNFKHKYINI